MFEPALVAIAVALIGIVGFPGPVSAEPHTPAVGNDGGPFASAADCDRNAVRAGQQIQRDIGGDPRLAPVPPCQPALHAVRRGECCCGIVLVGRRRWWSRGTAALIGSEPDDPAAKRKVATKTHGIILARGQPVLEGWTAALNDPDLMAATRSSAHAADRGEGSGYGPAGRQPRTSVTPLRKIRKIH